MSYYVEEEVPECTKCGEDEDGTQMYICPECEDLTCWECYEGGSQVCEECNVQLEYLDTYLEELEDSVEVMMFPNGRDGEMTELFIGEDS